MSDYEDLYFKDSVTDGEPKRVDYTVRPDPPVIYRRYPRTGQRVMSLTEFTQQSCPTHSLNRRADTMTKNNDIVKSKTKVLIGDVKINRDYYITPKSPIWLKVKQHKDGTWTATKKQLTVLGYGMTKKQAISMAYSILASLWTGFVHEDDKNLSDDAKQLKQLLQAAFIEMVREKK